MFAIVFQLLCRTARTLHSGNIQTLQVCAMHMLGCFITILYLVKNCTQDAQFVYNLNVFSIYTFTNLNALKKLKLLNRYQRFPLVSNLIQIYPTKLNNVDTKTALRLLKLVNLYRYLCGSQSSRWPKWERCGHPLISALTSQVSATFKSFPFYF